MTTLRWHNRVAAGLVGATYALLVFGASVRVHGAGLACPDWPLCFGEVIPEIDFGVFFEFGHRVLAGLISLVFLGLGAALFRQREVVGRKILGIFAFGVVALTVQIILGGLTVLELLAEWTVTSHLLGGNTFCLTLLVLFLALRDVETPVVRPAVSWGLRVLAVAMALLVPAQLALGGLVSSSYAGLVCPDWPSCSGGVWFPTFSGLVGLQVTHRLVAYVLGAAALIVFVATRGSERLSKPGALLLLVVMAQIAIGIANVLGRLPVEVTLLHTAGAAAIVLSTTWLNYEAWMSPVRESVPASDPMATVPMEAK